MEPEMQNKRLGNSDMFLSPLGIGAWAIAWSSQDHGNSINAIQAGLDAGMNWIDTAAVYGLGLSEELVAQAIGNYSGSRPYVFTKCGKTWNQQGQVKRNLTAPSIRRECEDSLLRLRVDTIDLYQIHWPQPDESIEEAWETLAKLKEVGKVRWIGVSNFNVEQMKRAHAIAPISSLQPPYSLARPDVEQEILPYVAQQNIGVLAYSPMASGLLSGAMSRERVANLPEGDWRAGMVDFQEPSLSRNLKLAEILGKISARHDRIAAEAALAWVLHQPTVTAAIVGIRTPEHVARIRSALEFRLTEAEIFEINNLRQAI